MASGDGFYCVVSGIPCGLANTPTFNVVLIPQAGTPAPITISGGSEPSCQVSDNSTTTLYHTTSSNSTGFVWSVSNPLAGSIDPVTGLMTWANGFYGTVNIQVYAYGCGEPSLQVTKTVTVNQQPFAEAGTKTTYSGMPVNIGDPGNGPGIISWSPASGLNNAAAPQPSASPSATTLYTITVNNNGCIATDTVTVIHNNLNHTISGKTRYLGKANAGTVHNYPTYNASVYNIDKVIVILKNNFSGSEIARDTSDAHGYYQFTNVPDGIYRLSYDKYTADTMLGGHDVNAIDVALVKYYVGADSTLDPSKNFSIKYRKAANVDNNYTINAIDVARIKAKVGSPYNPNYNFPKGNWVALDTAVMVNGSDLNVNLKTICYGDYNASSNRYRDYFLGWDMAKSLQQDIIGVSDEYIITKDPSLIEIPLRINKKMKDFSALGLELKYPAGNYDLVNAFMPGNTNKNSAVKINPSLDEIITNDNDLLVTDEGGIIRVVYATTNHYDVDANDEIIRLVFRAHSNKFQNGDLGFELSGTGVIGDQCGNEDEGAILIMPKIFVQTANDETGFDINGYPNPVSSNATIAYNLPENGTVKLTVYNALGAMITELVNETQTGGKHSVVFCPENWPKGIYTFRLDFTGVQNSKCAIIKMIY